MLKIVSLPKSPLSSKLDCCDVVGVRYVDVLPVFRIEQIADPNYGSDCRAVSSSILWVDWPVVSRSRDGSKVVDYVWLLY